MNGKVFCEDCKYLDRFYENGARCLHPENAEDTWYAPKDKVLNSPAVINHNNDCPWYEEKENAD